MIIFELQTISIAARDGSTLPSTPKFFNSHSPELPCSEYNNWKVYTTSLALENPVYSENQMFCYSYQTISLTISILLQFGTLEQSTSVPIHQSNGICSLPADFKTDNPGFGSIIECIPS